MTALKDRLVDPTRYTLMQWSDGTCDLLTPDEVEFLTLYREADDADKRRYEKAVHFAKGGGKLLSAGELEGMSRDAIAAWMDALPEVES